MSDDDDRRERRPAQPRRQSQTRPDTEQQSSYRLEPRMSIFSLAEYPRATHQRKRAILIQEKNPAVYQTAYRRQADVAIRQCLATGGRDRRPIDEALRRLRSARPTKDYDKQQVASGIETLESFDRCLTKGALDLEGVQRTPKEETPWVVEGVEISARPDAVIVSNGVIVGAIKRFLKKTVRLEGDRAKFAGVILRQYVERLSPGHADPTRCYILDVHKGAVIVASKSYKSTARELIAVCRDIFALWPSVPVKPPRPDRANK
jgi:hypothetical protein